MEEFFEGMTTLEQTYWIVALIGSAIFVIIFALTFIGGGDVDMEADMDVAEGGDDGGIVWIGRACDFELGHESFEPGCSMHCVSVLFKVLGSAGVEL